MKKLILLLGTAAEIIRYGADGQSLFIMNRTNTITEQWIWKMEIELKTK